MKYEFNFGNGVVCLPEAVLSRLDTAGELDLKLLLLLSSYLAAKEEPEAEKFAAALGVSPAEVEISLAFWRGTGILKGGKSPKKKESAPQKKSDAAQGGLELPQMALPALGQDAKSVPSYTGSELERLLREKKGLQALLDECQNMLGKVFSAAEANKIVTLADYYGLEDAYILLLCNYCKSIDRAGVAYVYKTATALYADNIDSPEALEAYIENRERAASFEGKMRTLMGIGARALSAREKKYFEDWDAMQLPEEVLRLAYDETVNASGKASPAFMNSILVGWKQQGVATLEQAQNALASRKAEQKQQFAKKSEPKNRSFEESSFNTDEFFDIALQKSMEIAKGKQENK